MNAILLLLFLVLLVLPAYCSPPQSFHLDLACVDAADTANLNLTEHQLLGRAIQRSWDRMASITPRGPTARQAILGEAPALSAGGEYLVKLGIGTPQHVFTGPSTRPATSSGCSASPASGATASSTPSLTPRCPPPSSSCRATATRATSWIPTGAAGGSDDDDACQYTYTYSGNATTEGTLAVDKLAIGDDVFRGVVFGCSGSSSEGPPRQASGVVGLGRGPLSLVSQLSVRRFMCFLPPPVSKSAGKLVLGADARTVRNASDRVVAPMATNPRYLSYYYLNVNGLAVGDKTAFLKTKNETTSPNVTESPAAGDGDSGADAYGMIIDIASTITFLEASLYEELANDLEEEIRLSRGTGSGLGLDLCFILPEAVPMSRVYVPPVSLAFDGAWLRLERERLFVEDKASGMMCLMVGKTDGVSILGNFQQQNMKVLYNLRRG